MAANKCKIENCQNFIRCKGLCSIHYSRINYNAEYQKETDRKPLRRFKRYKATCKRNEIPFCINFKDWLKLIENDKCYYCPNTLPTVGIALDRKYPDIGYFLENVVPCCTDCNKTKRDRFSSKEFKIMMDALNEYREKIQTRK